MFKIEKGIPLPALNRPGPGGSKRVFRRGELIAFLRSLEVGDSFVWPGVAPMKAHAQLSVYKLRLDHAYATRTVESGTRVWRVA